MSRLAGKVCVVTGAAGGIGAATVQRFQDEGATVVGVDLLADAPGDLSIVADVTDEDAVRDLYAGCARSSAASTCCSTTPASLPDDDASVLDTSLEAWQRVQDVNLKSVFLCCKHGIPHLLETGGGSVINTASFVAVMGAATSQISYTASKGGVLALSRELGVEFARQGVRVNALCPGPVDTPLLRELFAKDPSEAARRLVHVPMGRFAEADEIANAVVFLASDESSFITASTFLVDGGISGAYVTPRLREVVRALAGRTQREPGDEHAEPAPFEHVEDRDLGPLPSGGQVVPALGNHDGVLGELGPADLRRRLELGQLELALGLHAGVLDRAREDGPDAGRPSVVFAISRTRELNFVSFSPSARKAKTSAMGRSITTVASNRPAMVPPFDVCARETRTHTIPRRIP